MSESKIRHLVISSGGPAGHMMYSILRTLNLKGVWDIKDIRTIYGSSIGSFTAILIALQYDWETLDDFLIKRPWEKIFTSVPLASSSSSSSSSSSTGSNEDCDQTDSGGGGGGSGGGGSGGGGVSATIAVATSKAAAYAYDAKKKWDIAYKLYSQHALYGIKEFTEMLRPALQGKDMNTNITFQEFYDRTGIELHFIVTELNKFVTVDFSYKTHPQQEVIEAAYMSCCYPFIFTPIYRDGCCYVDGGIITDYPIRDCINNQKCDVSEILGIKILWERKPANLTEKSSVLQFISTFFNQVKSNLFENRPSIPFQNEVVCVSRIFSSQDWLNWAKDENYRRELVLRGETFANVFLSYRRNFLESNSVVPSTVPVVASQAQAPSPPSPPMSSLVAAAITEFSMPISIIPETESVSVPEAEVDAEADADAEVDADADAVLDAM